MDISSGTIEGAARRMNKSPFSTAEFIVEFSASFPDDWAEIVERYGIGGRGSGSPYSANVYMAQQLNKAAHRGQLYKLNYAPAPPNWGNDVIRYWALTDRQRVSELPKRHGWLDEEFVEGGKVLRKHLLSERHPGLSSAKRYAFRAEHGRLFCENCNFDPKGDRTREAAIEVHHAKIRVADMRAGHRVRLDDLQCLCANCHRIEHAKSRGM